MRSPALSAAALRAEQVLAAADELSHLPGVEQVEPGDIPGRPARFTTRELLEVEREALDAGDRRPRRRRTGRRRANRAPRPSRQRAVA